MKRLEAQKGGDDKQGQQSNDTEIDALFMFDRSVDLVTPFCVQQTYEGQLDEYYDIQCNFIQV